VFRYRRVATPVVLVVAVGSALCLPGSAFAGTGSGDASTAVHTVSTSAHSLSAAARPSAYKSFSSPASNARPIRGAVRSASARAAATGGTTLYVASTSPCSDSGNGTQADPYCDPQAAVNAASPGDIISIAFGYWGPLTVSTSDLTIDAASGTRLWAAEGPGLLLNGVSDVNLSGLTVGSYSADSLEIVDSTDVDFDSGEAAGDGVTTLAIDGASSGITISRSVVTTYGVAPTDVGISIAPGAQDVDIASDAINNFTSGALNAAGVSGLDVVGDTIQRSCVGAVQVTDGSTGASIENNVFIDGSTANDNVVASGCAADGLTWEPDVTVDASSASGATSDYNDFALYGQGDQDDTAPYSWAGTTYASLAAFQAGTSQGAHDTDDTTTFGAFTEGYMDALPPWGSPADFSANTSAPGAMPTDFYGKSPYNTRGAFQYQSPFPNLTETTSLTQTGAYSVSVSEELTDTPTATDPFTLTYAWGDGTQTSQSLTSTTYEYYSQSHDYSAYGSYTVTVTLTDNEGDTVTKSLAITLSDPDPKLSLALQTTQTGAYTTQLSISSPSAAGVSYAIALNETIAWGDGTTSTAVSSVGGSNAVTHTYTAAGNYTITVNATDAGGDTAQSAIAVTEADPDPNLAAGLAVTGQDTSAFGLSVNAATADPGLPYTLPLTDVFEWGDGTSTTVATTAGATASAAHSYATPDVYTVTVEVSDGVGDNAENSMTVVTAGSDYTAVGPVRILDTRKGIGAPLKPVGAGQTLVLPVAGAFGIPAGITAVAVNLTVTNAKSGGYVTAYYDGDSSRPGVSNVNFSAGQTVANYAVVSVGADGKIDLYNSSGGTVDLIADVSGYFLPAKASGYTGLPAPVRLLDTHTATGGHDAPVTPNHPVTVTVGGVDGLPAGITAVAANITVANATGGGYVTAWPAGGAQPAVSNVNFGAGQVIANAANISVAANGRIELAYNGTGSIRLVVDVYGYYSPSGASAYIPLPPQRIVDTRSGTGGYQGPIDAQTYYPLGLAVNDDGADIPAITGAVLNTTVTRTQGGGYLSVVPDTSNGTGSISAPATSNLNFTPGATVPNLTYATPGTDGVVDFVNASTGSLYLIIDLYGEFMNQ
jgi:hypothetical protein